jgi:glutathione S-transferase
MPVTARFSVRSTAVCPIAQRVLIALAARGTDANVETVADEAGTQGRRAVVPMLIMRLPGEQDLHLAESSAMIELVEDLHPRHPLHPSDPADRARHRELMETGRQIQAHLSAATRAREQNELDIVVHRLRKPLEKAEAQLAQRLYVPGTTPSNVDAVFAPTLWRLRLLDEVHRTFFLSGCPNLRAWADALPDLPCVRQVLPDTLKDVYLERIARRGAIIADRQNADAWAELATRTTRVAGAG